MRWRSIYLNGYYLSGWDPTTVRSNAPKINLLKSDLSGRFIIFAVSNTRDVIVNIYAPSRVIKEKQELRQKIFRDIRGYKNIQDKKT